MGLKSAVLAIFGLLSLCTSQTLELSLQSQWLPYSTSCESFSFAADLGSNALLTVARSLPTIIDESSIRDSVSSLVGVESLLDAALAHHLYAPQLAMYHELLSFDLSNSTIDATTCAALVSANDFQCVNTQEELASAVEILSSSRVSVSPLSSDVVFGASINSIVYLSPHALSWLPIIQSASFILRPLCQPISSTPQLVSGFAAEFQLKDTAYRVVNIDTNIPTRSTTLDAQSASDATPATSKASVSSLWLLNSTQHLSERLPQQLELNSAPASSKDWPSRIRRLLSHSLSHDDPLSALSMAVSEFPLLSSPMSRLLAEVSPVAAANDSTLLDFIDDSTLDPQIVSQLQTLQQLASMRHPQQQPQQQRTLLSVNDVTYDVTASLSPQSGPQWSAAVFTLPAEVLQRILDDARSVDSLRIANRFPLSLHKFRDIHVSRPETSQYVQSSLQWMARQSQLSLWSPVFGAAAQPQQRFILSLFFFSGLMNFLFFRTSHR